MNACRLALGAAVMLLAGCATPAPDVAPRPPVEADTGLDRMERLTLAANQCWIRSGDPAFASFSLSPELSSFSGRPRFLLVPKGRYEARPLLVVEGRAGSAEVETYGPLLGTATAPRIRADVARWSAGASTCSG